MPTPGTKFPSGVHGGTALELDNLTSAPAVTTNKVYFLNGVLTADGVNLETTGGGGGGTLDEAYENGRTITVDGGALVLNDATTGALNTVEFNKTGAGSGNILDFDFTAAFTGNVLNLDFGSAVAAVGIVFDCEGGARTGADLLFTSDGSGAHSLIDINESGSGTAVAFDWTGSNNGSPGGQVFLCTFDDNDNLTTEVMQLDTGAGARGIMFDFNFGHTDSGTTSHIWDIDVSTVIDSNIFDFASSGACTGNVFFLNLDNSVAMTALHVEGSGVRTQPMMEVSTDATGSSDVISLVVSGAISGNLIDVAMDTTSTGNVLDIDMNASVGGKAIYIDSGNAARTAVVVDVLFDGTGNADCFNIDHSNTGSGMLFDINVSGTGSGNVIDITYSGISTGDAISVVLADAVAGSALVVTGAGSRTDDIFKVDDSSTSNSHVWDVNLTGAHTGNGLDITTSSTGSGHLVDLNVGAAAYTGDLVNLDLGATATTSQAIVITSGAMLRSTALIQIGDAGTSSGATFDINHTGVTSGIIFDIDATAATTGNVFDYATSAASTGTIFEINMTNAVGAKWENITLAGTRTADAFTITDSSAGAVDVFQITSTSTSSGHFFNIDVDSVFTGNVFDVTFGTSAATGDVYKVDMGTNLAGSAVVIAGAGARTDDYIKIDDTSTSNSHTFDINISGNSTGNCFDLVYSASAVQGHALHVDMGTNLAGNALLIDAAGIRTAPLIYIANTGTDGGTDDHVLFINQTGLLDSNLIQLTFATAASTGDGLAVDMGSVNVAGRALTVTSAGTGVSGEGCALDVTHTGALVAGADVVNITSSSNLSATSNLLALEQATGAGTAGANCLYIEATGTNVEAIEIEAGLFFQATATANGAGNGETLSTAANISFYDPNGASRTGVILAAGLRDGQQVTVINFADAAEDITFAASGTSNVAGGTSVVISQFESCMFTWNSTRSLWYAEKLT